MNIAFATQPPEAELSAPESKATEHLFLLDGLRGLAALGVVMLHYYHFYYQQDQARLHPAWRSMEPGGSWLGLLYVDGVYAVNVFWMISGFVFAHVYCGKAVGTREFVVYRFARLYPLHFLTLLVVAALQLIAFNRLGYFLLTSQMDWRHFVQHILFVPGWGLDKQSEFDFPIWS